MLYKTGDAVAGWMSGPFYISIGFDKVEIASISKVFGLVASMAGVILGGWLVLRIGIMRALLIGGVLQALSNLAYIAQLWAGHDVGMLAVTIATENVTGGIGSAAFVAYLSRLCNPAFTATQYALLSALAAVSRTFIASGGGWLADKAGMGAVLHGLDGAVRAGTIALAVLDGGAMRRLADPQQPRAVAVEPVALPVDAGRKLFHQFPEPRPVIHLAEMRDLVRHDIFKYRIRRHDQAPGKSEVAVGRATAPACRGVADGDAADLASDARGQCIGPAMKFAARHFLEEFDEPAAELFGRGGHVNFAIRDPAHAGGRAPVDAADAIRLVENRYGRAVRQQACAAAAR